MEDSSGLTRLFARSREMASSAASVFEVLLDVERRPTWCPGVVEVRDAASPALSRGDTWVEVRDVFGEEEVESVRVVDVVRPSLDGDTFERDGDSGPDREPHRPEDVYRLTFEVDGSAGTSRSGRLRFTWTVTPADAGCRVDAACDAGRFTRKVAILSRFLVEPYARQVEAELAGLESATGDGGHGN